MSIIKPTHLLLLFNVLFSLFTYSSQMCAFTGSPKGLPPKRNSRPTPPITYSEPIEACPYYTGKPVCCNRYQHLIMRIFPFAYLKKCQISKILISFLEQTVHYVL